MKNLVVDQSQLESVSSSHLKSSSGFKLDRGGSLDAAESPEGGAAAGSTGSSEPSESMKIDHPAASLESRPSPEVEVEVVASDLAPPPAEDASLRSTRHSRHRSSKRKYEELAATNPDVPALNSTQPALEPMAPNSHPAADASNESASIGQTDADVETDVARWKRLYAGSGIEHDGLHVHTT